MSRSRLFTNNEVAVLLLFVVAGLLALAGRQLYGDQVKAALYEQVRALPAHADPYVLAGLLVAAIIGGGFLLHRFREASLILYGAAEIVFAGVAGGSVVPSFARQVLHEAGGPAVDVAMLAAFAGLCAAVYVAVRGWDNLLRGRARRMQASVDKQTGEAGAPLNGLLTPATMARLAAQLALQLATYAAAEAARQEKEAGAASVLATAAARMAARDAETAQADAKDWSAARTALANASLAVRQAAQG